MSRKAYIRNLGGTWEIRTLMEDGDLAGPGPIGGTTPAAGAFTTLSASGLISANGGQIAFPATQNASSNANTLDDYEEGAWTATDGSGAGLTIAGSGSYVKIGQFVLASFNFTYPATANGSTAIIAGFPFAFESLADGVYGGAIGYSDLNATGVWLYTNTNAASARISDAQNLNLKTNAQVSGKSFRGFCAYRTTA